MRRSIILWTVTFLTLPLASMAATSDEDSVSSESVIVAATRIATPEEQVASSVTTITAQDIAARQAQTLPEVLKTVPGLNLVQTGGPGGLTSIFMRGTNANHVKVLVDGIDVSDPSSSTGTFDFAQFLLQDVERIEILRGPQSGLYGSDPIGGVISITTRGGSGPARLKGYVEGGSFQTFNQGADLGGSSGQFHYTANIEHVHNGSTPVTPLDLLAPGGKRNNDYNDNLTGSTKLGLDVTERFDLGLVARYTDTHLRVTGDDFNAYPSYPEAEQSASNTLQLYTRFTEHSITADGVFEQTGGVAYSHTNLSGFTPLANTPPPASPVTRYAGERFKIDWQGVAKLADNHKVILGAEHERQEIRAPISAAKTIDGGYAELQSGFYDRFFTTANVRYDHDAQFGGKVTYRATAAYLLKETHTKLKASIGTGFKAPTLDELFEDLPLYNFRANPNLRPEASTGWEAGFEQQVAVANLSFGATYFRNKIKDLMTDNADFTSYVNIGRVTTQGAESFIAYQLPSVSIRLDYTYTEATDDILDQELLRRPRHTGTLEGKWQATQRLSFNATLLTVGSWVDVNRDGSIPRLDAPPYTTLNLAGSFDLNSTLIVFAHIDNLLDRRFENPVGYLQPSLGAYAGIKVSL